MLWYWAMAQAAEWYSPGDCIVFVVPTGKLINTGSRSIG